MSNPISQFMRKMRESLTHWPTIPDDATDAAASKSFEERMVSMVQEDFAAADQFLTRLHEEMQMMHASYHNGKDYTSIRKDKRFPVPFMQEQVDQFVANLIDKIFYGGRPCSVIPLPGTEKSQADAKQEMLDWQDFQQKARLQFGLFAKDVALYRFCCAKVENVEKTRRVWGTVDIPVIDEMTGLPAIDPMTGEEVTESQWQLQDRTYYKGAWYSRIDPLNVFFGRDKQSTDDDHPVMIREEQPKRFFYSRPYFYNQEKLLGSANALSPDMEAKRSRIGLDSSMAEGNFEYIEWHGYVDKAELYQYQMERDPEFDPAKLATVRENERCFVILGLANGDTLVRCDDDPLFLDSANIVIGVMEPEEGELVGASLADKILPAHKGLEEMFGMMMENFKQAVNMGWGIDWQKVLNKQESINRPGFILQIQGDPNTAMKRFEPYPISKDIFAVSQYIKQAGQDAGGGQEIMTGKGDPATNTLGESQMVFMKAAVRLNRAIEAFETSFIQPLYSMRNQVNMAFIDQEFAYYVLNDKEWKIVDPATVRADVDFICQSAQRETNRAVLTSQILQLIQIAPTAIQNGQPVRVDIPMGELCSQSFGWKEELIERIFPLLKFEKDNPQVDINGMLVQNSLLQMGLQRMMAMQGAMGMQPGGGKQLPQPTTESDAISGALKQGQPEHTQADF